MAANAPRPWRVTYSDGQRTVNFASEQAAQEWADGTGGTVENLTAERETLRKLRWLAKVERQREMLLGQFMDHLGDYAAITGGRNIKRGKLERRFGAECARQMIPTVRDEALRVAEAKLADFLERNAADPEIARIARVLEQAEELTARMTAEAESRTLLAA